MTFYTVILRYPMDDLVCGVRHRLADADSLFESVYSSPALYTTRVCEAWGISEPGLPPISVCMYTYYSDSSRITLDVFKEFDE